MNFVIVGGTHGNELLGIDIVNKWNPKNFSIHSCKKIIGNPQAMENKVRYIDYDLNRSFGVNAQSKGYEKERVGFLKEEISKEDFVIDLHTTTSNMGFTIILSKSDSLSTKIAQKLASEFSDVRIILSSMQDESSTFLNTLGGKGFLIEIGPCEHNSYSEAQFVKLSKMLDYLFEHDWDEHDFQKLPNEFYRIVEKIHYPDEKWKVADKWKQKDFSLIRKGDDLLVNIDTQKTVQSEHKEVYPIFIEEKSYEELRLAMYLCEKVRL